MLRAMNNYYFFILCAIFNESAGVNDRVVCIYFHSQTLAVQNTKWLESLAGSYTRTTITDHRSG